MPSSIRCRLILLCVKRAVTAQLSVLFFFTIDNHLMQSLLMLFDCSRQQQNRNPIDMDNIKITFIGAGNMAASLIGGLCQQGVQASQISASDPSAAQLEALHAQHAIKTYTDNSLAVGNADIIVLAVKPQNMRQVCEQLAPFLSEQQLIISIAAGITSHSLSQWLAVNSIVRCMPNTPSLIQQGVSGLYATEQVSAVQREQAQHL